MTVGILLLTEDGTGVALHGHLRRLEGDDALNLLTLTINHDMSAEVLLPHIEQRIDQLDSGGGVLILVDVMPAQLSTVLDGLQRHYYLRVVSGVNQAMLNAIVTHSDSDLTALAETAVNDARQAIQISYSSDGPAADN